MDSRLRKGIMSVLVANMINVIFNLGTSLLLPKFLSIDSYAQIKTYQLYISYAGLLHFGFVDGMYLRYGGRNLQKRIDSDLVSDKSTMYLFQIIVTFVMIGIALVMQDNVLLAFSISVFPINLINYFKLLYQATGEFKLYGRILNATTILTFVVNVTLLFAFHINDFTYYLFGYTALYYTVWMYFEINFNKKHEYDKGKVFDKDILLSNIKNGFLLTLGNLSSVLLTSMDRWFVKALMTTYYFAQYSFAVTVETFLNTAITPVTTTLYNFFCREMDEEKHRDVFKYVLVFATILPASGFLVKFILEIYLQNYMDSSPIIFWLFAAQMFYIVNKSIFVNLYKAQKRQNEYFLKLTFIIVIGFALNAGLYKILNTMEAFAIGTFVSAIIWFVICCYDFKYLNIKIEEYLFLFMETGMFIALGMSTSALLGLGLYIIGTILFLNLFLRSTFIKLLNLAISYKNKMVRRIK